MARDTKFIVFNSEEAQAKSLRASLLESKNVKILAEVDEPALLPQAVKQFPVDIILANLDPSPEVVLPAIGDIIKASPNIAVFAVSESTDGPLILKTMRLGVQEFFPKPIESEALLAAIEKTATQQVQTSDSGILVSIMGAGGGVGSTTIATNLAVELATMTEGSVTLVDLDYRFGQVATFLDVEPTYTVADLCSTPEALEQQVVERALVKHESGLQVLSRPTCFSQAELITAASCVGMLSTLQQFNDYVIVDGPLRSDPAATSVLDISDVNLLLVELLVPTVRNAQRILDSLREGGFNLERTKLVCNRTGCDAIALSVEDVCQTLSLPEFASVSDDWQTVSGAINLGETLQSMSPKSRVRQEIKEIANRLHTPSSESDDKDARKKGLIGRIFAGA